MNNKLTTEEIEEVINHIPNICGGGWKRIQQALIQLKEENTKLDKEDSKLRERLSEESDLWAGAVEEREEAREHVRGLREVLKELEEPERRSFKIVPALCTKITRVLSSTPNYDE